MNTQQIQNTSRNVQRTIGNLGLWLGLGLLLIVAARAINDASRRAAIIPNTGSPFKAQSVPEAGAQGVAGYLQAHRVPYAQTVPDAAVQSVTDYLQMHSSPSAQTVPDASVQSVMNYIRLHSNDLSLREYDLGERYGETPQRYTLEQALREYLLGERYGQTP
jgi:hypothetical protein